VTLDQYALVHDLQEHNTTNSHDDGSAVEHDFVL
jgi:hypothetical protein